MTTQADTVSAADYLERAEDYLSEIPLAEGSHGIFFLKMALTCFSLAGASTRDVKDSLREANLLVQASSAPKNVKEVVFRSWFHLQNEWTLNELLLVLNGGKKD